MANDTINNMRRSARGAYNSSLGIRPGVNITRPAQSSPSGGGGGTINLGSGTTDQAQARIDQILTENARAAAGEATSLRYPNIFASPTAERTRALAAQIEDSEISRLNREIDIARGRVRGEADFGEGSLGRVGETLSPELQTLQNQRLNIAEKGFGADAFQAAREARLGSLNKDQAQQQRSLRSSLAASGVYGGLAGAQQLSLMGQQQKARSDAERQLMLDDVGQRQQNIGAAEQTVRGNQADTLQRQQYNLAQKKGELMGRITAQYGEAALGVAERGAAQSAAAAKDYANAVRSQGGGKK